MCNTLSQHSIIYLFLFLYPKACIVFIMGVAEVVSEILQFLGPTVIVIFSPYGQRCSQVISAHFDSECVALMKEACCVGLQSLTPSTSGDSPAIHFLCIPLPGLGVMGCFNNPAFSFFFHF